MFIWFPSRSQRRDTKREGKIAGERRSEREIGKEREVFRQTIKGTHWSLEFVELRKNVH